MPTLIQILLDPITLMVMGMYAALMLSEALFPAVQLPKVPFWRIKGIVSFFFFLILSTYFPFLYASWLPPSALIDLSYLHPVLGGLIGVLVYEFGMYLWHRAMHQSNVLWKIFHQMHHSAERLDTFGAFYFSPMDMIGFTILGTICFSFLLGLAPQAITLILLLTNFFSVFQHANIRTPYWVGYLIQRPESHSFHHARGIHQGNYSDLPVFDIIFGTFHNPRKFEHPTGFYEGASSRVSEMLLFKDVSQPKTGEI